MWLKYFKKTNYTQRVYLFTIKSPQRKILKKFIPKINESPT